METARDWLFVASHQKRYQGPRLTERQKDEIAERMRRYEKRSSVAKQFGIPESTVWYIARQRGVEPRPTGRPGPRGPRKPRQP